MSPDEYLQAILTREAVDTGPLLSVHPSGSFMKGTANMSGTDIDLFISPSEQTTETLKDIYDRLFNTMKANGYTPTRQNVSINIRANGYAVDLVSGKRQNSYGDDHNLYRRKANTLDEDQRRDAHQPRHARRLQLLTWQELTAVLPRPLQKLWRRNTASDPERRPHAGASAPSPASRS